MKMLEVDGIYTEIDQKVLLEDISFSIDSGSAMALVGHNGAGKSTLIKTILGILEKSKGTITVNNHSIDESYIPYKEHISYLPEEPLLLTELTAMQHFQLYGLSYDLPEKILGERIDRYVKGFELEGKLDVYPESLSKGMRQKVQAICAFLPDIPLLLIDEPFMGLDVYAIDYMEQLIREKIDQGTSILLTTHQLDKVKRIAGSFIMLEQGKLIEEGRMEEFNTITRSSGANG
ncbi:MAG TPA: ABC transporter ATP-binding protein [Virgibacillus sp.]|nr:ABC transporter ATP-binding protein [Virgibacillus sp.]